MDVVPSISFQTFVQIFYIKEGLKTIINIMNFLFQLFNLLIDGCLAWAISISLLRTNYMKSKYTSLKLNSFKFSVNLTGWFWWNLRRRLSATFERLTMLVSSRIKEPGVTGKKIRSHHQIATLLKKSIVKICISLSFLIKLERNFFLIIKLQNFFYVHNILLVFLWKRYI